MAGLIRIFTLLCVAGCHPCSASPVLRSALVVQAGQNVSLTCNLTSCTDVNWYLLRSDQLLPLLTVGSSNLGEDTVNFLSADSSRINNVGTLKSNCFGLEIQEVQEEDAGLYFCIGICAGTVGVNRGIHLAVNGVDRESARQPCWNLVICVLPGFLVLCVVIVVGLCLCSGKPAVCCCHPVRSNMCQKVTEVEAAPGTQNFPNFMMVSTGPSRAPRKCQDESLHYSSLKHAEKPHPFSRGRTGLVREEVTYSTVNPHRSRDPR